MKSFSFLGFGFLIASVVSSCGKDSGISSPRETVFAYYKLVYDASSYSTLATVDFFDGDENGAKLDLGFTVKAKVTFDQITSSYDPSTYSFYQEYSNKRSTLTARYNYISGTIEYKNALQIAKDISLPTNLFSIDRNLGVTIKFGGTQIAAREVVVLTIGNLQFTNKVLGSNSFVLSPNDLASLSAGAVKISIERHIVKNASEGSSAGGKVEGVFIAAPKVVTII
jgi:hypothetical protein